jgi:hypothetical protein
LVRFSDRTLGASQRRLGRQRGSTVVWFILLFASVVSASISGSVPRIRMSSVPAKVRRETITFHFEADRSGASSRPAKHREAVQKLRAREPPGRFHTHSPFPLPERARSVKAGGGGNRGGESRGATAPLIGAEAFGQRPDAQVDRHVGAQPPDGPHGPELLPATVHAAGVPHPAPEQVLLSRCSPARTKNVVFWPRTARLC